MSKVKLTICWLVLGRKKEFHEKICDKFGIDSYMSVNKETPCEINEEDMELLRETERRGFIEIRFKKDVQ